MSLRVTDPVPIPETDLLVLDPHQDTRALAQVDVVVPVYNEDATLGDLQLGHRPLQGGDGRRHHAVRPDPAGLTSARYGGELLQRGWPLECYAGLVASGTAAALLPDRS
jgi:hypothetical protein